MKFALNGMGFASDDLEANAELLSTTGYDGIEPNLTNDGPLWNDNQVASFANKIDQLGLDVPAISTTLHWEQHLSSVDDESRAAGIEVGERMIEVADALNASAVLIVPAVVTEETPYQEAYNRGIESVRKLAKTAAEYDVSICVENVWNDFLLSPLEFAEFVDKAAEAGPVGVYFDIGNVRRFGHPEQWIQLLGERIKRIHVKDYKKDIDTIEGFTYPLQGDVDWYGVREAISSIGYDGWVTAEVPPYQTAPERMPAQLLDNLRYIFS